MIFRIAIFLLIFSPLAFGTVEPWSFAVMESLSLLALALFLIEKRRKEGPFLYETPGLVPLSLFLGYILLQLVPLPPVVLKIVSPATHALYKETLWAADPGAWGSLSINKKATLSEFFRLAAYAAVYILTIQALTQKEQLKKTIRTVVVFISFLAFFSMFQRFLWNAKIYWLRELPVDAKPFGPYVNRNHYAGLVAMVLPLIVCLFIYYRPRYYSRSLRERIVEVLSDSLTNVHVFLGLSALMVATSVFLSLSKGGILSLCLSMIFLAGMIRSKGREGKGWILVVLIVTLVFYSVGWAGWDNIFGRFGALRDARGDIAELRLGIWKDSLAMIKDFPLTGTGLGSYIHIYPKYRSISAEEIVDHAHNDYLELFSDGGLVAVLAVICFLAAVIQKSYRVFRLRRERYSVLIYIGSVTGIVSMLIHSITDFNLHIGANALYFFFLAGLAVSAANTRMKNRQNDNNNTFLGKTIPVTNTMIVTAVAVLLLSAAFNAGDLIARFELSSLSSLPSLKGGGGLNAHTPRGELQAMRDLAYRAAFPDPLNAAPHQAAARTEWLLSDRNTAIEEYKKAVRLDPLNSGLLQSLGLAMSKLGRDDKADGLLRAGIRCDGSNPFRYKTYASWLISSGKREDGAQYLRKAISLEPEKTRDYVTLLVLYGWTDEDIRRTLPDMVKPHLLFADYLHKTSNETMAAMEYHTAIEYVKNEKEAKPSDFYEACGYFTNRGLLNDALTVMRKAEESLPKDVGIKMALAEMYEKAGITYRAKEEYGKALMLGPGNNRARKKFEEIP